MAQMGRPKGRKKDTSIQIRISKEIADKFEKYCQDNGTTKTQVLTKFIEMLVGNK